MEALTVPGTNGQAPPEVKPWTWSRYTPPDARRRFACILWTLVLDGPFESQSGQALKLLRQALAARGEPFATTAKGDLSGALRQLTEKGGPYAGTVERSKDVTSCYRIACTLPPEALPPNPSVTVPPAKPVPEPPPSREQEPPPPSLLDPRDALTAIRGLVDEALGHGLSAAQFATAERLAGVLAEMEQLREERDQLQAALLERLNEVEALRRAFSSRARNG